MEYSSFMKRVVSYAEAHSKDPSTKVGCIILNTDGNVISECCNSMPFGIDGEVEERWQRPLKYKFVEHAERNCLYDCCKRGEKTDGATAIITSFCCGDCARGLIQAGIKTIVSPSPDLTHERWGNEWTLAMALLKEANITVIHDCF